MIDMTFVRALRVILEDWEADKNLDGMDLFRSICRLFEQYDLIEETKTGRIPE